MGACVKILIFGASGILGQHLVLAKPSGVNAVYLRRTPDTFYGGCDISDPEALLHCLDAHRPDAVVNLAGESDTDIVEASEYGFGKVNVFAVAKMADWCDAHGAHLVHVSTQAVFGGDHPPYSSEDLIVFPINKYGNEKACAEHMALCRRNVTIVRPTFVLGVRPLPHAGRTNPVEQMLGGQRMQVNDRWFSPSFAWDDAAAIWQIAMAPPQKRIFHLGIPIRTNRYEIARALGCDVEPASHDAFPGRAPRPIDTTYSDDAVHGDDFASGIEKCVTAYQNRQKFASGIEIPSERAIEIAFFLGCGYENALERLSAGFTYQHHEVARHWRQANPRTNDEILRWYRETEQYIWELSAYHGDTRWNYQGMMRGIADGMAAHNCKRILVLADGIGELTTYLLSRGFDAVYHDLKNSRTADFAKFLCYRRLGRELPTQLSDGWEPKLDGPWDAVICLDFLEHVVNVPAWCSAIHRSLTPGGWGFFQNAFNCGSGPDGSIPCHLAQNDKYEKEWTPLMESIGFTGSGNWWKKQ